MSAACPVTRSGSLLSRCCRFVCRESLGEGGQAAAYLLPVPADAVVYGSGDAAVAITKASMPLASPPDVGGACLSCGLVCRSHLRTPCLLIHLPTLTWLQEQAAHLYSLNMQQYSELKGQLLAATAVLVALGSALAYAAGGRDLALPFALGGASGMLYQYMLQASAGAVVTWRGRGAGLPLCGSTSSAAQRRRVFGAQQPPRKL